jgi:hypothetical protein
MRRTRKRGGEGNPHIFYSNRISTQQNADSSYKEVGVIHLTGSKGINAFRTFGTQWATMVGQKGFENGPIDLLRNETLHSLEQKIPPGHKVCNLRSEIDQSTPSLILHHMYGTLLRLKKDNR